MPEFIACTLFAVNTMNGVIAEVEVRKFEEGSMQERSKELRMKSKEQQKHEDEIFEVQQRFSNLSSVHVESLNLGTTGFKKMSVKQIQVLISM